MINKINSTSLSIFIFIAISITQSSCVSSNLLKAWSSDEKYGAPFQNIMVMGLVNNVSLRASVEDEFVTEARRENIKAGNGMSMFPPELGKPFEDIERVKARLRDKGYDAILTVALINVNAKRYITADAVYQPYGYGYYDRFGNYYYQTYSTVYREGYFTQNSSYFIECNLYELTKGALTWSGRSKEFNYEDFDDTMQSLSKELFDFLKKEDFL
jgi:hypothetical protein